MLVWVITGIACCFVVGVFLARRDESHQRKRKLRQIRQRLEEIEQEKQERQSGATELAESEE